MIILKKLLLKILISLLVFIFLFNTLNLFTTLSFANDVLFSNASYNAFEKTSIPTTSNINHYSIPNINARSAIVLDRNSKKILYKKKELNKVKMASTTKIMTALIVLENSNTKDVVTVSKKAATIRGSRVGLKENDKVCLLDLLYSLMLCSGNDAAIALSEHVGGSVENFCDLMNKKALSLGLKNTHFESPHGLDSDEHYTTAYELSLLADYALKNELFAKIVNTKFYSIKINNDIKELKNTNELLGNLNGIYGIKTGFTNGANRCLVTACKRNNMDIICVVLGCDTKKFRTSDSTKLIEYVYKNFEYININNLLKKHFNLWLKENLDNIQIIKGNIDNDLILSYIPVNFELLPIEKSKISTLTIQIICNKTLIAPINCNSVIGSIKILENNSEIYQTDIILKNTIKKKNIKNYLIEIIKELKVLSLNSF